MQVFMAAREITSHGKTLPSFLWFLSGHNHAPQCNGKPYKKTKVIIIKSYRQVKLRRHVYQIRLIDRYSQTFGKYIYCI